MQHLDVRKPKLERMLEPKTEETPAISLLEMSQKDRKTTQKRRDLKAMRKADEAKNGYDSLAL